MRGDGRWQLELEEWLRGYLKLSRHRLQIRMLCTLCQKIYVIIVSNVNRFTMHPTTHIRIPKTSSIISESILSHRTSLNSELFSIPYYNYNNIFIWSPQNRSTYLHWKRMKRKFLSIYMHYYWTGFCNHFVDDIFILIVSRTLSTHIKCTFGNKNREHKLYVRTFVSTTLKRNSICNIFYVLVNGLSVLFFLFPKHINITLWWFHVCSLYPLLPFTHSSIEFQIKIFIERLNLCFLVSTYNTI